MNLEEIRKNIDRMDDALVKLLSERMEQVLLVKKRKSSVHDGKREQEIMERLNQRVPDLLGQAFIQGIFSEIFRQSKDIQQKGYKLIGFHGEHGAYGEVAARRWNGDLVPIPCGEFAQVFERVDSGLYDYGIVPVENTLGGVVGEVNELLIKSGLNVVGAVELRVRHCLLALPGTDHRDIRSAYSHPQALSQCRRFLGRNKLTPVPFRDTAGAAKMLAEKRLEGAAAIASGLCADLYGLDILKEGIEDLERNITRFLVLSKDGAATDGNKCSILFATEHKAGTLFRVLDAFAKRDINLTRIESIPNNPGDYVFFLDFIGSRNDDKVMEVLDQVRDITTEFRLIGCYSERSAA